MAISLPRLARTGSGERCIDVPGIGRMRQGRQPGRHRIATDPLLMGQRLVFPKRTVETREAERTATLDAGASDLALDRREFERKRPHLLRKPCQHFGLESLD